MPERADQRLPAGALTDVAPNFLARFESTNKTAVAETPVHVFVMGPGETNHAASKAAQLRLALIALGQEVGFAAKAEHSDIANAVRALGEDTDLCTIELTYAQQSDVLVIIPSSHGAAAEIGFFAAIHDRGDWLSHVSWLILLDEDYENEPGFVRHGPVKMLGERGARVEILDLADAETAGAVLRSVVDAARRRKIRNKLNG